MYTVQIHCAVPTHIELSESMLGQLAYRSLANGGIKTLRFNDRDAFFYYVRGFDYVDAFGNRLNHFLNATMVSVNDSRRHKQFFDNRQRFDPRRSDFHSENIEYYFLGYLASYSDGRVIDLRNYENELYSFDYASHDALRRQSRHAKWLVKTAERDARRKKDKTLTEGEDYWGYYRRIQTTQERRYAADIDHKPFVRGRRNVANLPNAYDDLYFHREKSWKARTKCRYMWEVNLPKHIDTVCPPPVWNEDLLEEC